MPCDAERVEHEQVDAGDHDQRHLDQEREVREVLLGSADWVAGDEDEAGDHVEQQPEHADRHEALERRDRDALADPEHPRVDEADSADDRGHSEEVEDLADRPDPVVGRDVVVEAGLQHQMSNCVYHCSASISGRRASRPTSRRSSGIRRGGPRRSRGTRNHRRDRETVRLRRNTGAVDHGRSIEHSNLRELEVDHRAQDHRELHEEHPIVEVVREVRGKEREPENALIVKPTYIHG